MWSELDIISEKFAITVSMWSELEFQPGHRNRDICNYGYIWPDLEFRSGHRNREVCNYCFYVIRNWILTRPSYQRSLQLRDPTLNSNQIILTEKFETWVSMWSELAFQLDYSNREVFNLGFFVIRTCVPTRPVTEKFVKWNSKINCVNRFRLS